ncbi:hypothetical protein BD626DRAFT_574041 [Schizophyllum amplum]|uniref:F-box domain-containing protein n=1 Tax=Schizophyllum amplum TaxID=97359 RepID=A0A550BZB2_9AGAR|nr:hypothetical protein BD626DRAFT_574041 [Auriculariopsis ampla]
MLRTLNDLPNELLEHITRYISHWERLPPRLSVYGVLSRVSRRLRAFALPYLFAELRVPVKANGCTGYVLKARPLVALTRLFTKYPCYKEYIRHMLVGTRRYPTFEWRDHHCSKSVDLSEYCWHLLNADRSPWNLQSFTSLAVKCRPTIMHILGPCKNLRVLSMRWQSREFPDLSHFPHLELLRLVGKTTDSSKLSCRNYHCIERKDREGKALHVCPSLRTLALHEAVRYPLDLVTRLPELYPNLRVLVVHRTALAPTDVLHIVAQNARLEEVNADCGGRKGDCRLENVMDVMCGRVKQWSYTWPEKTDVGRRSRAEKSDPRLVWTNLWVDGFAFVRERDGNAGVDGTPFKITSLALRLANIMDGDAEHDALTALLDRPLDFSFRHIRHFALSFGWCGPTAQSFAGTSLVEDFMEQLGQLLSHWESLETFIFHHDLNTRSWHTEQRMPVLDGMDLPSYIPYIDEHEPTLAHCLCDITEVQTQVVLQELSRILGRRVWLSDEDVNLDEVWMDRHEPTITRGVRAISQKCTRLQHLQWFVDCDWPSTSWAYDIRRDKDGWKMVTGQASRVDCLRGELLPFSMVVGQELRAARSAWVAQAGRS